MADYKVETLRELLKESARRHKERNAFLLKDAGGAIYGVSYSQFEEEVRALGTALISSYKSKGKNIGIFMENSYEWCCSFMAITSGAGVAVPLDKDLPSQELYNILSFAEIEIIFTDSKGLKILNTNKTALKGNLQIILVSDTPEEKTHCYSHIINQGKLLLSDGDNSFTLAKTSPDDIAAIFFTSGTTGMTKGVMLTNLNLCSDFTAVSEYIQIYESDLSMSMLPLHHTYELISFLMVVYSGASISFSGGIRTMKEDFLSYKPTVFVTVPLILEKIDARIHSKIRQKRGHDLSGLISKISPIIPKESKKKLFGEIHSLFGGRLRLIICGAAKLNKETALHFSTYGIPVIIGYGLTECSPIIICNNDSNPTADSVGKPLPGVTVKIEKPDENGVGEICAKGPMVMKGYYKDPVRTEEVIKDGWFHTGDLGYRDKDGNYRITGRIKNIIVTRGGKNIYPEEIEYYLTSSPFVAECIIYCEGSDIVTAEILPDTEEIKKQLRKAAVTHEETHKAIKDAVRTLNRSLPSYKRIKKVTIRETPFDKTSTHKIKRK